MNPIRELKKIATEIAEAMQKDAARDLVQQRRDLQKAPKEKLIKLLELEDHTLEHAEQFGYEGDRAGAAAWMKENAPEDGLQAMFWDWDPGTPEEGEEALKAVGI